MVCSFSYFGCRETPKYDGEYFKYRITGFPPFTWTMFHYMFFEKVFLVL